MPTTNARVAGSTATSLRLVCAEVWGGNRPVHAPVELPGIRGILYSHPCDGGRGGDVHYLSVCGSGLLSRMCLADVVGHGETVASISAEMHEHLRRSMNRMDQRKVLVDLNQRLESLGLKAMTTAAAMTFYPPTRLLSVSYAGHPPGWLRRGSTGKWERLSIEVRPGKGIVNAPMAIDPGVEYTQRSLRLDVGDQLLMITDGVLEAPNQSGRQFGEEGVEASLGRMNGHGPDGIADGLLRELRRHCGHNALNHDDVTFLAVEIVPGPAGPPIWHAIKNRLFRPRGSSGHFSAH